MDGNMAVASNTLLCHTFSTAQMANLPTQSQPLHFHSDVVITVLQHYSWASVTHKCTVPGSGSLRCHVVKNGSRLVLVFPSVLMCLHTKENQGKKTRGLLNSGCDDSEVVWINGVDQSGQGGVMEMCIYPRGYIVYDVNTRVTYFPSWFLDRSNVRSWEHFHLLGGGRVAIWFPHSFREMMA